MKLCRIRSSDHKVLKVIADNLNTRAQIMDAEKQARIANTAKHLNNSNPDFYYCVIAGGKS